MNNQCPIKRLRKAKGLTRRDLARKSDISYENLSLIETGVRKSLTDMTVPRLARLFNIGEHKLREEYNQWRQSLVVV